jgi:molecular chaperone GrpE
MTEDLKNNAEANSQLDDREQLRENLKELSKDTSTSVEFENRYKELQKKYTELEENYKRLWADQQNMIGRFSREKEDVHRYAAETTLESILPALDNFDFAKKSINSQMSFEEILKSFDMLKAQLMMSLQSIGLEEISPEGIFDPAIHEAVSTVKDSSSPEGTIVDVVKRGFKLKNKVIRPALVVVSTKDSQ